MAWRELFERALAVFFPKPCAFCGDAVEFDAYWCGNCLLPHTGEKELLGALLPAVCPFDYDGIIRGAILEMKQAESLPVARFFAGQIALALKERGPLRASFVVPVPQSKKRMQSVGYNQAAVLAKALGQKLKLPVLEGLLLRKNDSLPQHELDAGARFQNAAYSYRAAPGAGLSGEELVLVDDVLTTGATACACAGELLAMGASRVWVAACATVPGARNLEALRLVLERASKRAPL